MQSKPTTILALAACLNGGLLLPVVACGYHDPTMLAVGALNWIYPNSLHVTGAIWEAQQAGRLPMPDKERIVAQGKHRELLESVAFQKTHRSIRALDTAMQKSGIEPRLERFSLVLVETALWSHFRNGENHQPVAVDVGSPGEGDLVVVTGEVALYAIAAGDLKLSAAVDRGLMRLYGEPPQKSQFLEQYGTFGAKPLPSVSPLPIRPTTGALAGGLAK